jgi:microcystin-dependent protein
MQAYTGEIRMFVGSAAPQGWAFCDGQLLSVTQYNGLFNLIGFSYGGDCESMFALPDFRGRFPIHKGQGTGLTPRNLGDSSGLENVVLAQSQMPSHHHHINASSVEGTQPSPQGTYPAYVIDPNSGSPMHTYSGTPNTTMNVAAVTPSGGNQPHDNMPPFLCVSFIICLSGQ